jgi:hypothetical protein
VKGEGDSADKLNATLLHHPGTAFEAGRFFKVLRQHNGIPEFILTTFHTNNPWLAMVNLEMAEQLENVLVQPETVLRCGRCNKPFDKGELSAQQMSRDMLLTSA